jgi:hypothetical protein
MEANCEGSPSQALAPAPPALDHCDASPPEEPEPEPEPDHWVMSLPAPAPVAAAVGQLWASALFRTGGKEMVIVEGSGEGIAVVRATVNHVSERVVEGLFLIGWDGNGRPYHKLP